jgi:eukaryotic-like serine/threonine-protein kinase
MSRFRRPNSHNSPSDVPGTIQITSADGSQVAYAVVENDRSSAYVVATSGGAVRKVCDDCIPHLWASDSRRLVVEFRSSHPRLRVLDTRALTMQPLFDADKELQRVFLTADDRWIAIGAANVAWILRFEPGYAARSETASTTVSLPASDQTTSRIVGWSRDGRVLYSLLGIDGFRCLYAQRIDLTGGTPAGEPIVVHHFHDPERAWGSTPMGNAITDRGSSSIKWRSLRAFGC